MKFYQNYRLKIQQIQGSKALHKLYILKLYKYYSTFMLNYNSQINTIENIVFQYDKFFIRPTLDSKSFAGQIMTWEAFTNWREKLQKISEVFSPATKYVMKPIALGDNEEQKLSSVTIAEKPIDILKIFSTTLIWQFLINTQYVIFLF